MENFKWKFKSSQHFSGNLKVLEESARGHQKLKHGTPAVDVCLTRLRRSEWLGYWKNRMVTACLLPASSDPLTHFLCSFKPGAKDCRALGKAFQGVSPSPTSSFLES